MTTDADGEELGASDVRRMGECVFRKLGEAEVKMGAVAVGAFVDVCGAMMVGDLVIEPVESEAST
jgi:hypothetical protein